MYSSAEMNIKCVMLHLMLQEPWHDGRELSAAVISSVRLKVSAVESQGSEAYVMHSRVCLFQHSSVTRIDPQVPVPGSFKVLQAQLQ